ncbi:hypothetical protein GCM10009850_118960 [Nonomuraea monospora]|uniref:CHAT domain-containing protein n=1 Tax=Nonomuraea monospora TaxID=568818 RepID=A0ABN3D3P4_9ACTN
MTDSEVRRLARAALTLLDLLLPDREAAGRIRRDLTAALALPPVRGEYRLLKVLSSDPVLAEWMLEQRGRTFRDTPRHLIVSLPEQIGVGHEFSVVVWLSQSPGDHRLSGRLDPFGASGNGSAITVTVEAPGLVFLEHQRLRLPVPGDGDSAPVEFGLRGLTTGTHNVRVRAFEAGRYLGGVVTTVKVHESAVPGPTRRERGELPPPSRRPGQATLEVSALSGGDYSLRLLAPGADERGVRKHLGGEPRKLVEELVQELGRLAMDKSPFKTRAAKNERLKNLGVGLWLGAVPDEIREQFWQIADDISSFAVVSSADVLPWELLYPMDGSHDRGFLIQQFPVTRGIDGQPPELHLPLRSAAYVTSKLIPKAAADEFQRIRQRLGPSVRDRGQITTLTQLTATLGAPPSVLHFACHNDFSEESGSVLSMHEGPFRPSDLATVVARRSLRGAKPLIFFNACRTAEEVRRLNRPMGWASEFMAAGAGAFLGTLWPVRSSSARLFADAFYDAFAAGGGRRLGEAVRHARDHVRNEDGDPTWLAYTVYGDPDATAGAPAGGARAKA